MGDGVVLEPSADLRYEGQGYELTVPLRGGLEELLADFHAAHQRRFGHADAGRRVEAITARLRARISRERTAAAVLEGGGSDASAALTGSRTVHLDRPRDVPVYDRTRLLAGNVIDGPALVSQLDSTTLVGIGWRAVVDSFGNFVMERR
jgi:N-methylhydantoinase A